MRLHARPLITTAALAACAAVHLLGAPAPAAASSNQVAIIEDDNHVLQDPAATLQRFRDLGAGVVRVFMDWSAIAPDWQSTKQPKGFNHPSDPASYPPGAWNQWDAVVRNAQADGLGVDFVVTGSAPRWADGPGAPAVVKTNPHRAWFPSAAKFGAFVRAVGTRYSGTYPDPLDPSTTLPRVRFWSIWNEPNFGEDLGPQAIKHSTVSIAPALYRGLLRAGWQGLKATGHGHDTILIGELAARGLGPSRPDRGHPQGLPGNFSQTKPLEFIRTLYCVDSRYRPLRGTAAKAVGCPTTASGTRAFRAWNPGLFSATGFGDHPYPKNLPPTKDPSTDPNFATFPRLPALEAELDRVQRLYGSHKRLPIYNDEFGYITHPPERGPWPSPATAAYYLNWAEYLSWRSGRLASYGQYLLYDPEPNAANPKGGFADALLTASGRLKPAYGSFRMPIYLPATSAGRGHALQVWGCVRPAPYAAIDTGQAQSVRIQFRRRSGGSFTTVKTVKITSPRGYFDTHVAFPASGTVRLSWTYPPGDSLLAGGTIHSRNQSVTVR